MMPIDLVLVRHGQSEGNLANQYSYAGDKRGFTEAFKARPSWTWRLTDKGVWQAEAAGVWIRANVWHREINEFVKKFDRSYVSFFLRAMETAGHLGLGGHWLQELYLRERDWGQLDVMSQQERLTDFAREMNRRERDGIFFAPPGGESMAQLCLRIDRVLHTLHRECSDMQVIIVCHAEVMRAFQLRLERMSLNRFTELMTSEVDTDKIFNGGIIHYTRRHPETGEIGKYMSWVRSVCSWDLTKSSNDWREIKRVNYTAAELLAVANEYPRIWGKPEYLKGENE